MDVQRAASARATRRRTAQQLYAGAAALRPPRVDGAESVASRSVFEARAREPRDSTWTYSERRAREQQRRRTAQQLYARRSGAIVGVDGDILVRQIARPDR